ncbi:MAG: hypothetical protein M3Q08_17530 [Pseudomonadota bacterium]|nr:hypothetical protein [Pseudomonadota bacterium]
MDQLGFMMLSSPTFEDKLGYFPEQSVETVFFQLDEGIRRLRKKIGEERCEALLALSARMRAHFEADPEDKTDDAIKGRELIHEMEELLTGRVGKAANDLN